MAKVFSFLKKSGKISVNTLLKILKEAKPQEIEITKDGILVKYKKEF